MSADIIFCSGFGQFHTNEIDPKKPKKKLTPYAGITWAEVLTMAASPQSLAKAKAQWLIPSTLLSRNFKKQESEGEYWMLTGDFDDNPPTLDTLADVIEEIIGDCNFVTFTSYSAKKDYQKSRVLIMLDSSLNYEQWRLSQQVLNDKLEAKNIIADRKLERSAQLVYLPNCKSRGFYQNIINEGKSFKPLETFADEIAEKKLAIVTAEEAIEARKTQALERKANLKYTDNSPGSLITAFNDSNIVEDILVQAGYDQRGNSFRHPLSESGSYSASVKNGRVHTLSSSDPLYSDGKGAHDSFSAFCAIFHNNNQGEALKDAGDNWLMVGSESWNKIKQREWAKAQAQAGAVVAKTKTMANHDAKQLAKSIEWTALQLGVPKDMLDSLAVNDVVIQNIISNSFWNPQKRSVFTVTNKNVLNQYSEKDAFKFLCIQNGAIYNKKFMYELENSSEDYKGIAGKFSNAVKILTLDYLKMQSQRSNIEMRVDMFATAPRIEMRDELARIVYTHKPYPYRSARSDDAQIVADYKDHFPMFDDFLDFLIASRFSADRKKSYVWFKCTSDWGKGFLISVLSDLNMTVELSVKEVEAIFEGKPAGKSMQDFKSAIAIVIDEFKSVKSEIKQLQSEISLAPKNQLSFKVEIFSKLFFSAESVPSLIGEFGVEDQFLNRFSHFDLEGRLDDRELFKDIGGGRYITAIKPYVAIHMNKAIKRSVALGREEAVRDAELYIIDFRNKYGLAKSYTSLSDGGLQSLAEDIARSIARAASFSGGGGDDRVVRSKGGFILKRPKKYIEDYILDNSTASEKFTLIKTMDEIVELLSVNGSKSKTHRDDLNIPVRGILIKPELL